MCGLVGIASRNEIADHSWVNKGKDTLSHRGPDDAGFWTSRNGKVVLAHRRLAIYDLSEAGSQPMHRYDGLSVVFNGEIYNFQDLRIDLMHLGYAFETGSDTEVLLAAYAHWGESCLSRLNGMFAFAIFDSHRQRVFLARDRAGEKPLFYRLDNGKLYFASELKALLANADLPRRIDAEALDCYLAMGFVPGDRCILEGYKKLPAGHAMIFSLSTGDAKLWRYWQLPELEATAHHVDESKLLDQLEALLEGAVRRQLVADVPVGILLSGGLDSSLVTALAARHSEQLRTFSVGFPGHGKLDESPHARLIATHFGTEHVELLAEPASADLLPILASQFDEPMVDSSMLPTFLVSRLVREHCTVAIGGDGGDELFGGYGHYSRLLWMERWLKWIPEALRCGFAEAANQVLPVGFKGRSYLQSLGVDFGEDVPLIASYFDRNTRSRLLGTYSDSRQGAEMIRQARVPAQADLLQRATRMDFENYLADDILVKVDRASMLNSLEVRAPFLDKGVIEFAFAKVPSHLKATDQEKKILLKRLAARLLPPEFDQHRKQGFSIPMTEWLKAGPFREMFWDTLTSRHCLFHHKTVQSLLAGQDRGRNNGERLFALVQFELWRETYGASL